MKTANDSGDRCFQFLSALNTHCEGPTVNPSWFLRLGRRKEPVDRPEQFR